jgi:hypothetical protein
MSAEPTLAAQLREMIVPPACVELIEQAAARLDEQDDAIKHYHAETMGLQLNPDELERQLATVAQATIKQCAKAIDPAQYPNECDRAIAWKCYDAIRALAPHTGKQLTALIDELAALPGLSKLPLLPIEAILIEKTELSRLRTVAEAAKAEVKSNAWASLTLVAAVRALERGEVKS